MIKKLKSSPGPGPENKFSLGFNFYQKSPGRPALKSSPNPRMPSIFVGGPGCQAGCPLAVLKDKAGRYRFGLVFCCCPTSAEGVVLDFSCLPQTTAKSEGGSSTTSKPTISWLFCYLLISWLLGPWPYPCSIPGLSFPSALKKFYRSSLGGIYFFNLLCSILSSQQRILFLVYW